jgi:hypothetical protein
MVGTRTLACAALVLALAGCSGSSSPPSPPTSSTTQHTSHPGSQLTLNALPPIDLQGSVSGGDNGRVRILQNERKAAVGTSVSLLAVPGVGTLHVRCAQAPTTSFVLTSWAKGEGPPRVQHFNSLISRPVAFIPLNQLGIPPLAGKSGGPESYDVWQIGVFSEAFSGTATVWAIGGASGGHCQLEVEALLVTHGAWSRYAPAHG